MIDKSKAKIPSGFEQQAKKWLKASNLGLIIRNISGNTFKNVNFQC